MSVCPPISARPSKAHQERHTRHRGALAAPASLRGIPGNGPVPPMLHLWWALMGHFRVPIHEEDSMEQGLKTRATLIRFPRPDSNSNFGQRSRIQEVSH